ncbi:MAG TPA: M20/M25/M40 family metallo-hydrolase [Rhizomicrobium sp.]
MAFRIWIVAAALACALRPAMAGDLKPAVDGWRATHEADVIGTLDSLTRLPSVAADPKGLAAAAAFLKDQLGQRGFATELLSGSPGAPSVVFGSLAVPGAKRTVVFYAHYDGQPVTPSQWASDPFVPLMRNGPLKPDAKTIDWKNAKGRFDPEWRLFGRAVADDKTSIVSFLAAFDALKALGRKPSVNLKVFWEGEEEAGSPHLAQILTANRDRLAADLWLIGDGPVHQSRTPSLYFGARGVCDFEMTLYGPIRALHDGHYGNWVPNPAAMAANLIAQMRDDDGNILIPGFSNDVRPLTKEESAALAALPPIDDELKKEFQIGRSEGTQGLFASVMRPALNIRGIRAGEVGPAANNAIPIDADVSIDFRLVPDQTPQSVRTRVEDFLRAKGWTIVSTVPDAATRFAHPRLIRLSWDTGGYAAYRADMRAPASRAVIAAANEAAGRPVAILPMSGASVPMVLFETVLHEPLVGLPVVNHDDSQHAANENIRLQNLWDGIATYAALMSRLDW